MELKNIFLFENLDENTLKEIQSISFKKKFTKDSVVFFEGEMGKYLTVLTKGVLKIYKTGAKGNEIVMHYFSPTTLFAEMPIFEEIPYPATARLESEGEVLFIDYEKFKKLLERNPKLSIEVIKSLTKKMKVLERAVSNSVAGSAAEKVAGFIYENRAIIQGMKNTTIASAVNVTPETLSRILKKFRERGVITTEKRKIKEINKEELRKYFL